ncbi:MAG: hypothetical protein AAF558_05520 [Verrucomicrobiota bacterium]
MKQCLLGVCMVFAGLGMGMASDLAELRERLKASQGEPKAERMADGFKAYESLIGQGAGGYRVLADSWARDGIPESAWQTWKSQYQQGGAAKAQETLSAYDGFLSNKLDQDSAFLQTAVKRLSQEKEVADDALIAWMQSDPLGNRKLGYYALKARYPQLPDLSLMEIKSPVATMKIADFIRFLGDDATHRMRIDALKGN